LTGVHFAPLPAFLLECGKLVRGQVAHRALIPQGVLYERTLFPLPQDVHAASSAERVSLSDLD
jgi:hypothetical protein